MVKSLALSNIINILVMARPSLKHISCYRCDRRNNMADSDLEDKLLQKH
jgi:hypothetical protein